MNLVLFESHELDSPLSPADRRAVHVREVLRRQPGDTFDVGLLNGPRGRATLVSIDDGALRLAFSWGPPSAARTGLVLIAGLPRPQTARDILRDATTLGATALHFVRTEKGEASYAGSSLWCSGEWRRHVMMGAEQAFDTRIPDVNHGGSLAETLPALPAPSTRIVLDNYESPAAFGAGHIARDLPLVLALGAERGWSGAERELFRGHGFTFAHLGERVLRTETAAIAAIAIARARLGLM